MRPMLGALLATTLAIWASAEANATLVQWTLNNVTFNDGGTASGYFRVDTLTGQLDTRPDYGQGYGFEINFTDDGAWRSMYTGSGVEDWRVDNDSLLLDSARTGAQAAFWLHIDIDSDLRHTTQGTFQVLPGPTAQCGAFDFRCSQRAFTVNSDPSLGVFRLVTGGTVTAAAVVPEPSIFAFLASGCLLVIMRKWAYRSRATAKARAISTGHGSVLN